MIMANGMEKPQIRLWCAVLAIVSAIAIAPLRCDILLHYASTGDIVLFGIPLGCL